MVSSNSNPTEHITLDLTTISNILSANNCLSSHIKYTHEFFNKFLAIGTLLFHSLLVTLEISYWCPNIPHDEGINICDHFLRTDPDRTILTGTIYDLIRIILTMNKLWEQK